MSTISVFRSTRAHIILNLVSEGKKCSRRGDLVPPYPGGYIVGALSKHSMHVFANQISLGIYEQGIYVHIRKLIHRFNKKVYGILPNGL